MYTCGNCYIKFETKECPECKQKDVVPINVLINGQQLDALVAIKVMGWTQHISNGHYFWQGNDGTQWKWVDDFSPSTNLLDAWLVVEKLREHLMFELFTPTENGEYYARFEYNDGYNVKFYDSFADSAPLAICLASLKVVPIWTCIETVNKLTKRGTLK